MKASVIVTCGLFLLLGLPPRQGLRELESLAGHFVSVSSALFQDENQAAEESGFVFPILVEGKWGLIDQRGKIVVSPRFDSIGPMREPVNLVGEWVRRPPFVIAFQKEPILVRAGMKWGYIDKSGAFLVQPQYLDALPFSEGLAAVMVGVRWGFIDHSGKLVIAPQFMEAKEFSEGRAAVYVGDQGWGYIDRSGKSVIRPHFSVASYFREGMARVCTEPGRCDYIDPDGSVLDLLFSSPPPRGSRYIGPLKVGNRSGYVDGLHRLIVEPMGDEPSEISEGLPIYRDITDLVELMWIGETPSTIAEFARFFLQGLAVTGNYTGSRGVYTFVDRAGKEVLGPFDYAGDFSEGLAVVKVGDQYGYIDRKGNFAINPQFDWAGGFSEGLAMARINKLPVLGYIDKTGKMVIPTQFNKVTSFSHGLAIAELDHHWGYIDRAGKFVWGPAVPKFKFIQINYSIDAESAQLPKGFLEIFDTNLRGKLLGTGMFEKVLVKGQTAGAADGGRSLILDVNLRQFRDKIQFAVHRVSNNEPLLNKELENRWKRGDEKSAVEILPSEVAADINKRLGL
jgi:hypothetical protein